jgi:hypothetical protein
VPGATGEVEHLVAASSGRRPAIQAPMSREPKNEFGAAKLAAWRANSRRTRS